MIEQTPTPALSSLPSELITLALSDLEACERDPRYKVYMDMWHEPPAVGSEKCRVCQAGAIIAQTLDRSPKRTYDPWHFCPDIRDKLLALNHFHQGNLAEFEYRLMWCPYTPEPVRKRIGDASIPNVAGWTPYQRSHARYKDWVRRVIRAYRRRGL